MIAIFSIDFDLTLNLKLETRNKELELEIFIAPQIRNSLRARLSI